jgi:hypothetical protein
MNIVGLKTSTLRDAETMLICLRKVSDELHFREGFYPLLTRQAGRRLNGAGVIIVIQMAICDYVRGMPVLMRVLMEKQVDDFAAAIMADREVVRDALRFHAEANFSANV